MSSDRIAELHEQASEHYLNGDYGGALQAWRDVLALDPRNEQALDGVRMAAQYVERAETPAAPPELEHELEEGLTVLDSLGGAPTTAKAPARLDPGATMILDRAAVQGLIDLKPKPAEPTGWEPPAVVEEPSFELEPAPAPAPSSAAAAELKHRVNDLLAQAREKAEAGERDEALAILGRLAILDEENADAAALRTSLEAAERSDLDMIEHSITEGVQAIEADHLDVAERCFDAVLAKSPGHREALHYLETIRKKRAESTGATEPALTEMHEDLLAGGDLPMDFPPAGSHASPLPAHAADTPALQVDVPAKSKTPKAPRATPLPEPPVAPTTRRMALPSPKVLAIAVGALCLVALAVVLVPRLTGGRRAAPPAAAAAATASSRPAAKDHPAPAPAPASTTAPAPKPGALSVAPATAEDRAKAVAADIADGHREMSSGNVAAAVISFNEALKLDPVNPEAKAGLHDAVEQYKARKAELDAVEGIKTAFKDGEYTAALRLAYRLPPTVSADTVARIKVAGWYDLGIVALRAGECREAIGHFEEALAIDAEDADAKKLHEFAKTYVDAPRDRKFLDFVEALQFRPPSI
jgi:tetratricopeptide (TPR) repeat protein